MILRFTTALIIAIFVLPWPSAWAEGVLRFEDNPSERIKTALYAHEKTQDIGIAAVDLNQDGFEEYITKTPKTCQNKCQFKIIADTEDGLLGLGHFTARAVKLGIHDNQGVLDLRIYKNENNDYDFTLYRWDPEASQYRMMEKGSDR